jgi:hypothetical protein
MVNSKTTFSPQAQGLMDRLDRVLNLLKASRERRMKLQQDEQVIVPNTDFVN